MLLRIPNVLSAEQVQLFRHELEASDWIDGRATAGHQSARVKRNTQLAEDNPVALRLGDIILSVLERNETFISGSLPAKIVPPLFNRHEVGQSYGWHVDGSIRPVVASRLRVRTDISATLFLSQPDDYDGGELRIDDTFGERRVKLAAGDLVLYPGTSVHQVSPVERGIRYAAFFWIESMVREDHRRRMLFELDNAIRSLSADHPEHRSIADLTATYHNLIREWGSV